MVDAIRALGREIMIRWHEENYDGIREALSDLTPGRNDVPFERVYTEIWHFAFGIANRTLVEAGLFADSYAADRRYRGFHPAIWASDPTTWTPSASCGEKSFTSKGVGWREPSSATPVSKRATPRVVR